MYYCVLLKQFVCIFKLGQIENSARQTTCEINKIFKRTATWILDEAKAEPLLPFCNLN